MSEIHEINKNVFVTDNGETVKVHADFKHFGVSEDEVGYLHLTRETALELADRLILLYG